MARYQIPNFGMGANTVKVSEAQTALSDGEPHPPAALVTRAQLDHA